MANLYIHTKFHETYNKFKKYAAKYGDILSRTNIICDRQGNIRCVQPNSIKNGPSWYLYYTYSLGIFRALIFWYILLREPGIVGKCKNIFRIFVSRIRDNGLSRFFIWLLEKIRLIQLLETSGYSAFHNLLNRQSGNHVIRQSGNHVISYSVTIISLPIKSTNRTSNQNIIIISNQSSQQTEHPIRSKYNNYQQPIQSTDRTSNQKQNN